MPRKKCPGGHFILGFCVRGDTFRGDTIYYDTGYVVANHLNAVNKQQWQKSGPLTCSCVRSFTKSYYRPFT